MSIVSIFAQLEQRQMDLTLLLNKYFRAILHGLYGGHGLRSLEKKQRLLLKLQNAAL